MSRGELCPFDTAVAVEINTFRLESLKMNLADSLITGLQQELSLEAQKSLKFQSIIQNDILISETLKEAVKSRDITIRDLSSLIDNCDKALQRRSNWWHRNKFWLGFGTGIIGSSIATYYIMK